MVYGQPIAVIKCKVIQIRFHALYNFDFRRESILKRSRKYEA